MSSKDPGDNPTASFSTSFFRPAVILRRDFPVFSGGNPSADRIPHFPVESLRKQSSRIFRLEYVHANPAHSLSSIFRPSAKDDDDRENGMLLRCCF